MSTFAPGTRVRCIQDRSQVGIVQDATAAVGGPNGLNPPLSTNPKDYTWVRWYDGQYPQVLNFMTDVQCPKAILTSALEAF